MNAFHFWFFASIIFSAIFWKLSIPSSKEKEINIGNMTVPLVFILAFVLRVVLSTEYLGFGADIACFSAWADRMVAIGPAKFYAKDYFSDYPPLYLYVLYLIGLIKKTFKIAAYSKIHVFLLKCPSILADLGIGFCIYKVGTKKLGLRHGLCLSVLYLFQPIVILNSCLWGQIDAILTLFLILVCLFLEQQNFLPATLIFALGVLLKPQMLVFSPVMILGAINYVYRGSFSMQMLARALAYSLLALIMDILLVTPFGMDKVIDQYLDTLSSYPYASVNAYNFWAGIGFNWKPQTTVLGALPCSSWGFIAIVLATLFSLILGIRLKTLHEKYFVVSSFLSITVFTFSVRMHERYLFPITALLLFGFIGFASKQTYAIPASTLRKDKEKGANDWSLSPILRIGYPVVSTFLIILHFYNTGHVLFYYDPAHYDYSNPLIKILGLCMTVSALGFYFVIYQLQSKNEPSVSKAKNELRSTRKTLQIPNVSTRMTKTDLILLLLITVLYSVFALRDLGDLKAPQTVQEMKMNESVVLHFPENRKVSSVSYFIAPTNGQKYDVSCQQTEDGNVIRTYFEFKNVFCWETYKFNIPSEVITMVAQNNDQRIAELVFLDEEGNPVTPINASDYPNLFDEQELYPDRFGFRNGTYFDEIYHARTAYEFLHGLYTYEWTHPPLGKILISVGVKIFGMTPFGWRIIGTLFGIFMLPILYFFAKKLTGNTPCAALTCWIFAFDFMHFAQTRIATIDVYIVFFVLCMYYFMYKFFSLDFSATPFKKLLIPLFFCGLSMGLGVASKWTGVYAGLGLATLFFSYLFILSRQSAPQIKKSPSSKGSQSVWKMPLAKKALSLIPYCVLFFVIIPLIIYVLSYIPFRDGTNDGLLQRIIHNQSAILNYHSTLDQGHAFGSRFYQWPTIVRPIWYYSGKLEGKMREGISSFGNPFVWWAGIPAFAYMLYLFIKKKDRRAGFLVIGFLAQYLPWFFVKRTTFIYHYFPCVVFLVLMIGYTFRHLKEKLSSKAFLIFTFTYGAAVFGLFLLFYPILSGQPINYVFVHKYLEWFKTWYFVAK